MSEKRPLVDLFIERRIRGLTRNDIFFKQVDRDTDKYFLNCDIIAKYSNISDFTKGKNLDVYRALAVMVTAYQEGFIDVDWDRLFNIFDNNPKTAAEIVLSYYDDIKRRYPIVTQKWDEALEGKPSNKTPDYSK